MNSNEFSEPREIPSTSSVRVTTINDSTGRCPFCDEEAPDIMLHMLFCSRLGPQPQITPNIVNPLDFLASNLSNFRNHVTREISMMMNSENEIFYEYEDDYEANMALCELMGQVEKGLTNDEIKKKSRRILINKEDMSCPICLENMKDVDRCLKLDCGHIFCEKCIYKWFERKKTCPVCKVYLV